ncbi:hypothetical protein GALL_327870 [mine drainage metagenome]|uniref:Uncharacterized protein n=1 Tax=mine drainage metagenome TaxID=410659 RepID=A0A1J5QPQ8_9ZZZZ
MQPPAVAVGDEHRSAQLEPLLRAVRTEAGRDRAQVGGALVDVGEARRLADVAGDACQPGRRDRRAYVVEDQRLHRRIAHAGQRDADQPAHRRADPGHASCAQPRQQRDHVADILWQLVVLRLLQPVGAAAADDVGADDAPASLQRLGEAVEVAPLARQSVHAYDDVGVGLVAPLPVRHAVQAARVQALDKVEAGRRGRVHGSGCGNGQPRS